MKNETLIQVVGMAAIAIASGIAWHHAGMSTERFKAISAGVGYWRIKDPKHDALEFVYGIQPDSHGLTRKPGISNAEPDVIIGDPPEWAMVEAALRKLAHPPEDTNADWVQRLIRELAKEDTLPLLTNSVYPTTWTNKIEFIPGGMFSTNLWTNHIIFTPYVQNTTEQNWAIYTNGVRDPIGQETRVQYKWTNAWGSVQSAEFTKSTNNQAYVIEKEPGPIWRPVRILTYGDRTNAFWFKILDSVPPVLSFTNEPYVSCPSNGTWTITFAP